MKKEQKSQQAPCSSSALGSCYRQGPRKAEEGRHFYFLSFLTKSSKKEGLGQRQPHSCCTAENVPMAAGTQPHGNPASSCLAGTQAAQRDSFWGGWHHGKSGASCQLDLTLLQDACASHSCHAAPRVGIGKPALSRRWERFPSVLGAACSSSDGCTPPIFVPFPSPCFFPASRVEGNAFAFSSVYYQAPAENAELQRCLNNLVWNFCCASAEVAQDEHEGDRHL